MNELYGIEPRAFETVRELRLLLLAHGPYTGKYILEYPNSNAWRQQLLEHFSHAGDVERERLKSILIRAKEDRVAIEIQKLNWINTKDWIHNAIQIWSNKGDYKQIYVSDTDYQALNLSEASACKGVLINSMEPPPLTSSDVEIDTSAESYWGICSLLCKLSHIIHIIDPYFDPLKSSRKNIFRIFLSNFFEIPYLTELNFWIRKSSIGNSRGEIDFSQIEQMISKAAKNNKRNKKIRLNFVQDEDSIDKIHARYLLTNKGGIKVDQGFQELPSGRRNLVSAIAPEQYKRLYQMFSREDFQFKIETRIQF